MIGRILLDLVQGALTSLDTSMTTAIREEDREWWEEDRQWRAADVAWRELEERPIRALESEHRERVSVWRDTDREQVKPWDTLEGAPSPFGVLPRTTCFLSVAARFACVLPPLASLGRDQGWVKRQALGIMSQLAGGLSRLASARVPRRSVRSCPCL